MRWIRQPSCLRLVRGGGRGLVRCCLICRLRRRILHQEVAAFVNWVYDAYVDFVAAAADFGDNLVAEFFDFGCDIFVEC